MRLAGDLFVFKFGQDYMLEEGNVRGNIIPVGSPACNYLKFAGEPGEKGLEPRLLVLEASVRFEYLTVPEWGRSRRPSEGLGSAPTR
jgi:hypothetical protein